MAHCWHYHSNYKTCFKVCSSCSLKVRLNLLNSFPEILLNMVFQLFFLCSISHQASTGPVQVVSPLCHYRLSFIHLFVARGIIIARQREILVRMRTFYDACALSSGSRSMLLGKQHKNHRRTVEELTSSDVDDSLWGKCMYPSHALYLTLSCKLFFQQYKLYHNRINEQNYR